MRFFFSPSKITSPTTFITDQSANYLQQLLYPSRMKRTSVMAASTNICHVIKSKVKRQKVFFFYIKKQKKKAGDGFTRNALSVSDSASGGCHIGSQVGGCEGVSCQSR